MCCRCTGFVAMNAKCQRVLVLALCLVVVVVDDYDDHDDGCCLLRVFHAVL